ncbi:hypothetical protein CJU90_4144 [Yarrowia sp. C11]|nr:hypothetical protein CKK34_6760 [Yarrowia sp. E02]KAG5365084.1 hypothetical protein CJU90_4144 [Yarrowia sp. C11]
MTPTQPEPELVTVLDDEEVRHSSECIPRATPDDPLIIISSDEEDNTNDVIPISRRRRRSPEVIDISDTERPDDPEEDEGSDARFEMERIFMMGLQRDQQEHLTNGFGFFRQPHYPVRADRNPGLSSFTPRQFARYQQFVSRLQGIPGLGGPWGRDDGSFEEDIQRAMQASLEDSLSNYGPKKVSHPDPPTTTTEGYTRSVRKRQVVCCALCRSDLGVGVPPESKKSNKPSSSKKRKRFSRFSDLTDVERTLSKRMFFTKCGHVYCGLCVQFIKRRRTSRQKKEDKSNIDVDCITDFKGRYVDTPFSLIDHCVVPGCKEKLPRSRGKFFKEMFT